MFDYDWFHGFAFQEQQDEARRRCTVRHLPDVDFEEEGNGDEARTFFEALEVRCLVYLRDGFSYEIKEMAEVDSKTHLTFECEPVDEHYKVGAFVVSLPYDEIVRVEAFAVHPSEKPEDMPLITGFRGRPESPERPERPREGTSAE